MKQKHNRFPTNESTNYDQSMMSYIDKDSLLSFGDLKKPSNFFIKGQVPKGFYKKPSKNTQSQIKLPELGQKYTDRSISLQKSSLLTSFSPSPRVLSKNQPTTTDFMTSNEKVNEKFKQQFDMINLNKKKLITHLQQREPDKAVDSNFMVFMMKISIEKNSLALFEKSLELLADLFICCQDLNNALYNYNNQRCLGELTGQYHIKMKGFINIAEICKMTHRYDDSMRFLKKALEYSWYLRDEEQEIIIYERIGMLYFLLGNFNKANYYHNRSVNFAIESDTSPSRLFAKDGLGKIIRLKHQTNVNSLSKYLIAKLGMIGNPNLENVLEELNENEVTLKYTTQLSFNYQISSIYEDGDFRLEIPSPQHPINGRTENGKILKEYEKYYEPRIIDLQNKISKQKLIQVNQYRQNSQRVEIDKSKLKLPLKESITQRLLENIAKVEKKQYTQNIQVQQIFNQNTHNILMFNHMTPNRNIEGFNFYYKYSLSKIGKYFDEFLLLYIQ